METLREECPWDRTQTHATLRRHLLEETYEVLDVLDRIAARSSEADEPSDFDDLREELGDLLFQVVFHAHLARESGRFDLAAVADQVRSKLEHRHPAIFATVNETEPDPSTPLSGSAANWERGKLSEKGRASVMDGMPRSLPALVYAGKVLAKAAAVDSGPLDGVDIAAPVADEAELGQRLLGLVGAAREAGLDAEAALRTRAALVEEAVRRGERSSRPV